MENKKSNLFRIIKSVAIAYVITLILIMIFAILLTYTNVPESFMETGVLIISMLSILISSFLSVKKIKENGCLYYVINKDQGALSSIKEMEKIAKVEILEKNKGFYIIKCVF